MRVTGLTARDFRNYERLDVELGDGLTVVVGPNGAGKTNLLEALYFGCTGRSPRTSSDRELVRRGAATARVTVSTIADDGPHVLEAAVTPGEDKLLRADGQPVDSLLTGVARPLLSVFLPDRLALIKGPPSQRRAHLDHLAAAIWPARSPARGAYSKALAQRNALLLRIRRGEADPQTLSVWDTQLSVAGWELMSLRRATIDALAPHFARRSEALGLPDGAQIDYRPRSPAEAADGLAGELAERRQRDIERGFTVHGPHRDDFALLHRGVALRSFGSQGQQRTALLALLFAERDLILAERGRAPLMLLDDVMSELDAERRDLLSRSLRAEGQAIVTTTDVEHVPGHGDPAVRIISVSAGEAEPAVQAGRQ